MENVKVHLAHCRGSEFVDRATFATNEMYGHSIGLHAMFRVQPGDYAYVFVDSSANRGSTLLTRTSRWGDDYNELAVRQVSRVGQPDIPTDYLRL